jgi:acetyl esterase/lipase
VRFSYAWIASVVFGALCSANAVQPLSEEMAARAEKVLERQYAFQETADVVYGVVDGVELKGDLYLPDAEGATRPGMLMIHGGGWGGGDKATVGGFRKASKNYARMGFVVFNINYRLSGDAPAPAAVEDVKAALRFLHARAPEWNVDPARVVTTGGSAGAHLALMAALSDEPAFGAGGPVAAVLNRSGITDVHDLTCGENPRGWAQKWLPPATPDGEALARRLSPLSYAGRKKLPPVFTLHGAEDDIVPVAQAMRFHLALLDNGHASELYLIPFCGHGFGSRLKRHNDIYPDLKREMDLLAAAFFIRCGIIEDD